MIFAGGFVLSYLSSILFFWFRIQTANTMAWGARKKKAAQSLASFCGGHLIAPIPLILGIVFLLRKRGNYIVTKRTKSFLLFWLNTFFGYILSHIHSGSIFRSPQMKRGSSSIIVDTKINALVEKGKIILFVHAANYDDIFHRIRSNDKRRGKISG